MSRDLVVALVGCGQIADAHLQTLGRVARTRVAAVCDRYRDLARQAAWRFDVPGVFDDLDSMLRAVEPDVVHVTTPPQTHFAIVRQCLEAGSHVYVEKPFTVDAAEARALVACAESRDRLICLGLDQRFDPAWQRCRAIVASGALGAIVHVDAVQGYDLTGPFGSLVTTDPHHWVPRLPGGLLQNALPHALARAADFIRDDEPRIDARWFARAERATVATELRALIAGADTSASLLFSSAIRPVRRVTRVLGTAGSIEVDLDARTVTPYTAAALPGAFGKVELPLRGMVQAGRHLATNLHRLCRSELHYFEGMRELFVRFQAAIRDGAPPPVAHEDAIRLTALLDAIFRACRAWDAAFDDGRPLAELERLPA